MVGVLGCDTGFRPLELATTVEDEAEADALWALFGWHAGDPVVVLNTGAAYGAAKTWPDEHFTALARWLATAQQLRVLLICGPAERRAVAEICRQADHPSVKSLADQELRIGLSKACVRRGSLMVTTDSGPRHFAAAFDVPCITLFGPTDPAWSDNTNRRAIDLSLDLPCAPCAGRTCPLGHHRCMRDLTVEKVAAAVTRLMERLETSTDLPGRWYAAGRR